MILKNKVFSVSFVLLLIGFTAFGASPVMQSANYFPDNNQLVLSFDQAVKIDNVLLGLLSFDDDNNGPKADFTLLGGVVQGTGADSVSSDITINLVYEGIIDSYTGSFFGDNSYLFELWGTDVDQVKAIEAMDTGNLVLSIKSGAFVSANNETTANQSMACMVAASTVRPSILSASYDANINVLTLAFDSEVQYDLLAEDRSINNGPGNGLLQTPIPGNDDGEDRNANGILEFEPNIRPFQIGMISDAAAMTLENIAGIAQSTDTDTLDITLTSGDAKRLEATVGYTGLQLDVKEWAFVDGSYNPNLPGDASVTVIPDSVDFIADSASYDRSKNVLTIYFGNLMSAARTITLTAPAPVYTKFHLTSNVGSYTLNGVEGNPSGVAGFANSAFKFKLPIGDQAGVEGLLDGSNVTLSMNSFALYDNFSNGNAEFANVAVRIASTSSANEQAPNLIASSFDMDAHTLALTWDLSLGVGFYLGEALTVLDNAEYQDLSGILLYDSVADSTLALGEGKVYYSGSKKNTYIELSQAYATKLETYTNLNALSTYIDRDIFNAFLFLNGNEAADGSDAIGLSIVADTTAPEVVDARLNVFTKVLEINVNEPVNFASLNVNDFKLADFALDGEFLNDAELEYTRVIELLLTDASLANLSGLADSIYVAPDLSSSAGAFLNISSLSSVADTIVAGVGRTFYLLSYEAFASPAALHFGSLKLISDHCEIYVDADMWAAGKVNAENLEELRKAFENATPMDSTRGIKAIVDAYYGGILDTDGNGKVIIFLANILDEYDEGRNDTNDSFFENGYFTLTDTSDSQFSNRADLIYLDVDPQIIGTAPYAEWDESMLNALTYQYSLMSAATQKPEQERWINYGVSLKLQELTVGDTKFFGDGTATKSTASNELTYIAASLLKSRNDLFNVYNYLTYLTEKYPGEEGGEPAPFAIVKLLAESDLVGIAAVDAALQTLGYSATAAETFLDYGVACFLDLTQSSASDSAKYGGLYNFAALDLAGSPAGKNAGNLPWDKKSGLGAPFDQRLIQPWSFSFYVARSYFINLAGDLIVVSPDLNASDTLVIDGFDGTQLKASKILLHSGFLENMTTDFEVVNFEIDSSTARGQLPMTTDPDFSFRATSPDTARGVQLLALVIAKTDYAQPAVTYDYVISNVTGQPEFSDFYAMQNPDVKNYLDLFVVSERPVYNLLGEEGAVVEVADALSSVTVDLDYQDHRDGIVSIYSGKYLLTETGNYTLTYAGRDQNGISFDPVILDIGVGLARPATRLLLDLPGGLGSFSMSEHTVNSEQYLVATQLSQNHYPGGQAIPALPVGVEAESQILSIGVDGTILNKEAWLTLTLSDAQVLKSDALGVYVLKSEGWQYIGGDLSHNDQILDVSTGQLGRFVIASGDHPQEDLALPQVFSLEQNFPNPFNPTTTIAFNVPLDGALSLKVFNMLGQEVATLADGYYAAGRYELLWNARNGLEKRAASGVYFYTIESADMRIVKKMVLLK